MHKVCAAFAALLAMPSILLAQDVSLRSLDGTLEISGTLQSFDGELYRIETSHGMVSVDGAKVSCDGPGCPDLTAFVADIRIAGSPKLGNVLLPALIETFATRKGFAVARDVQGNSDFTYRLIDRTTGRDLARFAFDLSSTAEGFADLIAGDADLLMATREITAEEIRLGRDAGLGNLDAPRRSRIVALDALIPIVSRRNPISVLAWDDFVGIFTGDVVDWVAFEASNGPIAIHLRKNGTGLDHEFNRLVLEPAGVEIGADVTRHSDDASLSDAVARDPLAIGLVGLSELGNAKSLGLSGTCGKQALATATTVKTEDYPLTTPLFLYLPPGRPSPVLREFLSYIRSPQAQSVVARAGFVSLGSNEVGVAQQGQRLLDAIKAVGADTGLDELQRLAGAIDQTSRLSLSFRFEPGRTRLDAQSRSNIEIFAALLERGRFDGRTVIFVGFTDGEGPASGNLRLARRRANTVREAVRRAAPAADWERINVLVDAFGEAMPMACDDSEWGKKINRRVEVWIK